MREVYAHTNTTQHQINNSAEMNKQKNNNKTLPDFLVCNIRHHLYLLPLLYGF